MTEGTCSVDGCDRSRHSGGMCPAHYQRFRKYGDAHATRPILVRGQGPWSRVDRRGPDECWPWIGTVSSAGYGSFSGGQPAHRVVYEEAVGPIPPGMELDHLCHSADLLCAGGSVCLHRRCVNPSHMEVVTADENQRRRLDSAPLRRAPVDHCVNGHPYDEANTYFRPDRPGGRSCRACNRAVKRMVGRP